MLPGNMWVELPVLTSRKAREKHLKVDSHAVYKCSQSEFMQYVGVRVTFKGGI